MRKIDLDAYASRGPAHNKGRRPAEAYFQSNDNQMTEEGSSQPSNDNEGVDNMAALTSIVTPLERYPPRREFGYRSTSAAADGLMRVTSYVSGHHSTTMGAIESFSNFERDENDGHSKRYRVRR
jgi:hypothetical protein